MVKEVYECDLCSNPVEKHNAYKVYFGAGAPITFVGQSSRYWNEARCGRMVCSNCIVAIKEDRELPVVSVDF